MALGLATLALSADLARAQQPAASGADKEQAAKLAADAESFGRKQQFADALRNYKRAAELDPDTAAYKCNIGMAYYALGDEARAHLHFGRCHQQNGGWPKDVEDVFNYVIGVLGKEDFTPLRIQGAPANAEVLINLYAEEGPLAAPVTVYVPYSNYQIEVRADGFESKQIPVEANSRSEKEVTYTLERAAGGDTGGGLAGKDDGASKPLGSPDVDQNVDTGGGRKKWPLLLAGGGLVAGGIGIYAFTRAKYHQGELCDNTIDRPETEENEAGTCAGFYVGTKPRAEVQEDMRRNEAFTYSLWGIGGAAIAAGLYLYFTQPEDSGSSSVAVSASPTSDGGMVFFSLTH